MGVFHQSILFDIYKPRPQRPGFHFHKDGLRKENLIECFYCVHICHVSELFNHMIKCSVRKNAVVRTFDQLATEIAMIIFKFNDTPRLSVQTEFLRHMGITWGTAEKTIAREIYSTINFIKTTNSTPAYLHSPSKWQNNTTLFIPSYILYYIENCKHEIYTQSSGVIFALKEEILNEMPLVFSERIGNDWTFDDTDKEEGLNYMLNRF